MPLVLVAMQMLLIAMLKRNSKFHGTVRVALADQDASNGPWPSLGLQPRSHTSAPSSLPSELPVQICFSSRPSFRKAGRPHLNLYIYNYIYIYITIPGITKKNALLGNLQKKSDLQKNSQRLGSELPIQLALVPRTCIERAYPSPHP